MINRITFTKDCRVFKTGDAFDFRPGVNLIVGDQGCGKSTLLAQLAAHAKHKAAHSNMEISISVESTRGPLGYFDFEKHNPRTQPAFGMGYGYDDSLQLSAMFWSHGEFVRVYFEALAKAPKGAVGLLDEPDGALSPRSAYGLSRTIQAMAESGVQVIASVHNPILIESQPEVLSLEHRRWMPSAEFMELMRTTLAPPSPKREP